MIRVRDPTHDKIREFFLVILLFHLLLDVTVVIFKLLRLLGMHQYFIYYYTLLIFIMVTFTLIFLLGSYRYFKNSFVKFL